MVDRLQGRKIVIVDLDGTLVKGNSFHEFIKAGFKHSSLKKKLKLLGIFTLRILKLIDHRKMKFRILEVVTPDEKMEKDFRQRINKILNREVYDKVSDYRREGVETWLVTAAPDIYIPLIWDGKFFATETESNPEGIECRGENKVKVIRQQLKEGDEIEAVFTDHYDDLPLMELNAKNFYLVDPDTKTMKKFREESGSRSIQLFSIR